MISKELWTEVYGTEAIDESINIHEVAYVCTLWAIEQNLGYTFHLSSVMSKGSRHATFIVPYTDQVRPKTFSEELVEETVFKACQYILENRKL